MSYVYNYFGSADNEYNHENHENDDGDDVIPYHMSRRRCQVHKSLMPGKHAKVPTCHWLHCLQSGKYFPKTLATKHQECVYLQIRNEAINLKLWCTLRKVSYWIYLEQPGIKSKCPRFSFWAVFCLNGLTKVERKVSVCPVDRIIKSSERYCHWQAGGCYGFQLEKHSISAVASSCLEKCALFELSLTWGLCSVPLSTPGHS